MRALPFAALALLAASAAVAAARPAPVRAADQCPDSTLEPNAGNLATVAKAIVCEIDLRRADAGLVPLREQRQLDRSSQFQSDDMVESHFVAHNEPGHPSLLTRIRRTGYFKGVSGGLYTENIAVAPQEEASAAEVVQAWMLSDEHRAKILYGRFREIGVGAQIAPPDPAFYADRPSVVYTTDFGRRYWRRCGFRHAAGAGARRPAACPRRRRR